MVASPTGRLGDGDRQPVVDRRRVGTLATIAGVLALRRLNRRRDDAVQFAEAIAIEHDEQRSIAETLQLGLLPQLLDVPPHTEIACGYWPAGDAQLIGGDFWDVFRDRRAAMGDGDRRRLRQGDAGRR